MNGKPLKVSQTTDYPFDGRIQLNIDAVGKNALAAVCLRVPEWCDDAVVTVNGVKQDVIVSPNTYISIKRQWKKGDVIVLEMPMKPRLIASNPLVEESRNHVAVKRGPLVYCLEASDVDADIDNVVIPSDIKFSAVPIEIAGSRMTALEATALALDEPSWENTLYREVSKKQKKVKIRLIPHYAYGNRGMQDMTVWLPYSPCPAN